MHLDRLTRLKRRQKRERLQLALGAALILCALAVAATLWRTLPTLSVAPPVEQPRDTQPEPASVPAPAVASAPAPPPDPALAPYTALLQASALLESGEHQRALELLVTPPAGGYRLHLYHLLRARALSASGSGTAALSDAEAAHADAVGPERVETGVLLAGLRRTHGDAGGAADLLLELIPSSDLLFRGPLRKELLEDLRQIAPRLSMAEPADRERLMQVGDLFYNYGLTNEGIAIFTRSDWPEPASVELSRQRIRAKAFRGETDQAIADLARLAATAPAGDSAYLHYLRAIYLASRGRESEAMDAYAAAAAAGAGTYSGGMSVYRIAEPFLDADRVAEAERIVARYAGAYAGTSGWRRAAWELFASAYATGNPAAAQRALALLEPAAPSDPQYLYWRHRLAREHDEDRTEAVFQLLTRYPSDYYAFLARERWPGQAQPASPANPGPPPELAALERLSAASEDISPVFDGTDLSLPLALWRAGHREHAAGELRRAVAGTGSWGLSYLLGRWTADLGAHRESIRVMSQAAGRLDQAPLTPEIQQGLYPRFYRSLVEQAAAEHGVDPNFVFAIIREESAFEANAHSLADARGLMQIIPPTGRSLARQAGLTNFSDERLFEPEIAIPLGVRYLASLLKHFHGDTLLAAAAYNGGQGNVDRWLRITPPDDRALFVERIPYPETRNYVKKTDRSYRMYAMLYGGRP